MKIINSRSKTKEKIIVAAYSDERKEITKEVKFKSAFDLDFSGDISYSGIEIQFKNLDDTINISFNNSNSNDDIKYFIETSKTMGIFKRDVTFKMKFPGERHGNVDPFDNITIDEGGWPFLK